MGGVRYHHIPTTLFVKKKKKEFSIFFHQWGIALKYSRKGFEFPVFPSNGEFLVQ